MTLAEIKSAIDVQKSINEMVNKFFEGSESYNITTKYSNLNGHYQTQKGIESSLLLISFFKRSDGTMMKYTEIDKTYLDVYIDVIGLKLNFEKVQKPINDIVGKFFGTSPSTTLNDINVFTTRQTTVNSIVNKILGRKSPSESSLTGPTLAEIKTFIDVPNPINEMANNFFEGSQPHNITTTYSDLNGYYQTHKGMNLTSF